MKSIVIALFLFFLFVPMVPAAAQSYQFAAEHLHTIRNCRGTLVITPDGIEYKTDHAKDARIWQYAELRQIKVESPTELELVSYEDQKRILGRDRIFKFKLLEGKITPEISDLLMAKATRPPVTSVMPMTEGTPAFEIPVKHLHHFGGCEGVLKIYSDRVTYESLNSPNDSRYWRFADIQNFSQSERFRFEVLGFEEGFGGPKAYNFQLREELPAGAYDYVWQHVYPSKFHHSRKVDAKQ